MPDLDIALRVHVEKSPIPIVWLDTHVLIRLAQLELGKLASDQAAHYSRLRDRLGSLIKRAAVICPKADQPSEIWAERDRFLDTLYGLSMGVDMKAKAGIGDDHTWKLMSAHIKGKREIVFSYRDAFYKDPVIEVQAARYDRFTVNVDMGVFPSVEQAKAQRESMHQAWEQMRQTRRNDGARYGEQRELERKACFSAVFEMWGIALKKSLNGESPNMNEVFAYLHVNKMAYVWNELGGQPSGIPGLLRFIDSSHYAAHPINDIESALIARLMTGSEPIQSGDEMDVEQIATVLPFADLLVVDRKMKHYVNSLDLGRKYGAKVCSSRDWDEIDSFFRAVEGRAAT